MGYYAYDGSGNQWWVPTEGDAGYVAPAAPVAAPVTQGLSQYSSFNLGADNWIQGSDGNYYKQTGPQYNMEGMLQSMGGLDPTPYTAAQLQAMGATPMTINPEYNIDDGTMTGLLGAGLLFGGLGAFGGLLGGSGAATGGLADAGYIDTLGGMFGGNTGAATAAGGLADAGYINTLGDWASGSAFNPGAVMDAAASSGTFNPGAVMDAATQNAITSAAKSMIPGISDDTLLKLGSNGLSALGGLLSGRANEAAAQTNADAQIEAARIAAEAAKFKPVGVKTRFGESQFLKDAQGNVIGAGYALTPDVKAQQDALMGTSGQMLPQFQNAMTTTAPMGTAAQRAMSLGNQYLATDPLAQAQKYYNDQQAVMATQRERDLVNLENRLMAQGRLGLATGGTSTGMMAANPEMEALRNAQKQQDLALAAAATQGGMDYAKFGTGMVGTGGDLLKSMYGTQVSSLDPWKAAVGGAQYLEGLGQNALNLGVDIGKVVSPARSGELLAQGMMNAANIQQAGSYSPWGTALMNAGNALQGWQTQQQQQQQQQQLNNMFATALNRPSTATDWSYGGTWY